MKSLNFFLVFFFALNVHSQEFLFKKKLDAYVFKNERGKINKKIKYYDAYEFVNDHCIVSDGFLFGLVNADGEETIPVIYDELKLFVDNYYVAKLDNNYGIIDSGNGVLYPIEAKIIKYGFLDAFKMPKFSIDSVQYIFNRHTNKLHLLEVQDKIYKGIKDYQVMFNDMCNDEVNQRNKMKCDHTFVSNYLKEEIQDKFNIDKLTTDFVITKEGFIADILFNRLLDEKTEYEIKEVVKNLEVLGSQTFKGEKVNYSYSVGYK
ncbi:MAG: WG repeat-containing protein [Bacteroidia bacterium]|nr:WG repeat-containing protein [Bacteroidia bacterium]